MKNATFPRVFAAVTATIITLFMFDLVARMGEYGAPAAAVSATAPSRAGAA